MSSLGNDGQAPQTSEAAGSSSVPTGESTANVTTPRPPIGYTWGDIIIVDNEERLWRKCKVYGMPDTTQGMPNTTQSITIYTVDRKDNLPGRAELVTLDADLEETLSWMDPEDSQVELILT
ncbi:MAG: hypothetical protein Q9175_006572, partial [Cornicularia normoerica]